MLDIIVLHGLDKFKVKNENNLRQLAKLRELGAMCKDESSGM